LLVFREYNKNMLEASSLALGFFDGVHLGHQKVISNAVKKAQQLGVTSAAVTFSQHPRYIISKSASLTPASNSITFLEEKLELFENLGLQAAVIINFNESIAKMTAHDYLQNVLIDCLNAKNITIGYNHKFGQQSCKHKQPNQCINYPDKHVDNKTGNGKFLQENSEKYGFNVDIISPVKVNGHVVSSSAIRKHIFSGDVCAANHFLGRPFAVTGKVVHGQHLGRSIGFPTANLDIPYELIIPLRGVYKGNVEIDSNIHSAVINVGIRPTLGDLKRDLVEAHILNFDEDIYGKHIKVSFLSRIRDEKKFDSLDELKAQIQEDCQKAITATEGKDEKNSNFRILRF